MTNLSRPGRNVTGFANPDFEILVKASALLREVVPSIRRVAVMLNPANPAFEVVTPRIRDITEQVSVEAIMLPVNSAGSIAEEMIGLPEHTGLLLPVDATTQANRRLIIDLANKRRIPAVYSYRVFVEEGGLLFYGADLLGQFSGAASYVQRILNGESVGDLPVQTPAKFQLVLNLGSAKKMGITIPPSLLARADEVIE